MTVENYESGQERKWPLGPDIVEECQAVEELPDRLGSQWTPLFEPAEFTAQHGPLSLEAYRLSSEELK